MSPFVVNLSNQERLACAPHFIRACLKNTPSPRGSGERVGVRGNKSPLFIGKTPMSLRPLTLRPRRVEQVPSELCLDATPERDAAPLLPACLCAPTRSHPQESGPLLLVPAHLSPDAGGEGISFCCVPSLAKTVTAHRGPHRVAGSGDRSHVRFVSGVPLYPSREYIPHVECFLQEALLKEARHETSDH